MFFPENSELPKGETAEEMIKTLSTDQLKKDLVSCNEILQDIDFQRKGYKKIKTLLEKAIAGRPNGQ